MDENKDKKTGGKSLSADQISTKRLDRRTVLRSAGIAGLGAGAMGVSGCVVVPATGTGITDADNGPIIDPVGLGRGGRRGFFTGITDADNGPIIDPGGQGRG